MKSVPDIIAVASSIVPPAKGETFFNDNARKVFKSAVICLMEKGRGTIEDSWKLFTSPISKITELLKSSPLGAEGYVSIQDHSSKQALGVISVLMQYCGFFEYLASQDKTNKFTIDEWIRKREGGFIYLINREECTDTLRPFISLFVDLMAKKLLSMSDDPGRRIYMFLDEFGTLQMLPSILRLAIAGGSKGCVLVIGIQDFAQISKIYGPEKAESLFNSCGTAVIFNVVDPKTARFFAERIGEREFKEISETISMGLTDSRDGRSLTKGRKRELVILPSEIQSLKKREAYVKFPEHNPILLKVEITAANRLPDVTEPFIMRPDLTLESIIKRQEEISIKAAAITADAELSQDPDGPRMKTEIGQVASKETMENDLTVETKAVGGLEQSMTRFTLRSYKPLIIVFVVFSFLAVIHALSKSSSHRFILNLTGSEPRGIYFLKPFDGALHRGDLVFMKCPPGYEKFIYGRKWLPNGWPLLKTVRGIPGDCFCVSENDVSVEGKRFGPVYPPTGRASSCLSLGVAGRSRRIISFRLPRDLRTHLTADTSAPFPIRL
jgi:type IV secretory pathway protease TraF